MQKMIVAAALIASLSACSVPDQSKQAGAVLHPHTNVDTLPESYRDGSAGFTGVIVYGDKGYTGIVGNIGYPSIMVDGQAIGKCEKRRAKIIPLTPGAHVVAAQSENTVTRNITLAEGQTAYFRCNFMRIGGVIFPPAVLDPAEAATAYSVVNGG